MLGKPKLRNRQFSSHFPRVIGNRRGEATVTGSPPAGLSRASGYVLEVDYRDYSRQMKDDPEKGRAGE